MNTSFKEFNPAGYAFLPGWVRGSFAMQPGDCLTAAEITIPLALRHINAVLLAGFFLNECQDSGMLPAPVLRSLELDGAVVANYTKLVFDSEWRRWVAIQLICERRQILSRMAEWWCPTIEGRDVYESLVEYWAHGIDADREHIYGGSFRRKYENHTDALKDTARFIETRRLRVLLTRDAAPLTLLPQTKKIN